MKNLFNSPIGCPWLCLALFLTIATPTVTFSQCVSPPARIGLYANEAYMLTADAGLSNYQWFRDTGSGPVAIVGATSQTYEVSQKGRYSWTAQDQFNCPAGTCCPQEFFTACSVSIVSVSPSACDGWSNSYDVGVRVTYNLGVMADIIINGQRFTPAGLTGTQTFRIGRFTADGTTNIAVDVSVDNIDGMSCLVSRSYNAPANCRTAAVDPIGYIYCEQTGQIITGGSISVIPPAGGVVNMIENGSNGRIQWLTNGVPGVYTMVYTPPAGYSLSAGCLPQPGALDPTGMPDPFNLGMGVTGNVLNNPACSSNPYYMQFNLSPGDPLIDLNNIPLRCPCPSVLATANLVSCDGNLSNDDATISLSNLVNATHFGYNVGSLYTGPNFTAASVIPSGGLIATSLANPALTTPYTIRVFNNNECYQDFNVSLHPKSCTCPQALCLDMASIRIK